MTRIVIMAILEAVIAYVLLPWLPPKLHGIEVLIVAGEYFFQPWQSLRDRFEMVVELPPTRCTEMAA